MTWAADLLARSRRRVGTARRSATHELRRPVRLRRPFFSPARERRRALATRDAIVAGRDVQLGDWETHTPVLAELFALDPGARVLELGVGYGSTPLVLGLSSSSVSLETDPRWLARFQRNATATHTIALWRDFTEDEWRCPYLDESWDIALVDNAPARSRQSNLEKLAGHTRFVVCHDTQECFRPSPSDYRWDFTAFRHVWTYTQYDTYTTVVSNLETIPLVRLSGVSGVPRRHER